MMKKVIGATIVVMVLAAVVIGLFLLKEEPKIEKDDVEVYSFIENVELPSYLADAQVIEHIAYSLQYNEDHEQADWVAYTLINNLLDEDIERTDDFRRDTMVVTGSAEPKDYKRSGYDRGHLAPAADMKISGETMSESFFMSNMSPQKPGFNRGIWKRLEEQVRDWAAEYDTLYVVTGPVLENGLDAIGENEVSIPNKYYKALLIYKPGVQTAVGFILNNESSSEELESFAITIDSLEIATELDFFSKLQDGLESKIESTLKIDDWFITD